MKVKNVPKHAHRPRRELKLGPKQRLALAQGAASRYRKTPEVKLSLPPWKKEKEA